MVKPIDVELVPVEAIKPGPAVPFDFSAWVGKRPVKARRRQGRSEGGSNTLALCLIGLGVLLLIFLVAGGIGLIWYQDARTRNDAERKEIDARIWNATDFKIVLEDDLRSGRPPLGAAETRKKLAETEKLLDDLYARRKSLWP